MKVKYDPGLDILRLRLNNAPIEESDELRPGTIIDYDAEGNIIGIEILDASLRMDNPRIVQVEVEMERPAVEPPELIHS
jgi:uncharacterized protein YuzE